MTEVFIAAVSTTKFQLNQQDLQFYKDQKAKQIIQVRSGLENLQKFGQLSKKQRPMANHATVWKNLLVLAKIIGYESQFSIVNQLSIPQHILTQQLWHVADIFTLKRYPSRASFGNIDKYYILMEGVVEKEIARSSIAKVELEGVDLSHCKIEHGSRFRKQNRKCFGRTQDQIPICLNSKRSQGRNGDAALPLTFRTLTETDMFEIPINIWKNYVKDFKKLREQYLMNFIRKRLNLSLNFGARKISEQENIELTEESFYNIVTFERKNTLQFVQTQIYLLYMGQMLLETPYYRVQVSRGCILNPISYKMMVQSSCEISNTKNGAAIAKTMATVIKIPICKLQLYFREVQWQKHEFIKLLKELQQYRKRNKEQQDKIKSQLSSPSSRSFKKQCQSENKLHYSGISPKKLNHLLGTSSNKILAKEKIMGFKNIQNLVQKTAKAAELKHIEYLRKAHLSEDSCQSQQNFMIPQSLFKDCMKNIEVKSDMLKIAVKIQRQKLQQDAFQKQLRSNGYSRSLKKMDRMQTNPGSDYLLKRIKGIYIKTEGSEERPYFSSSERQTLNRSQILPYRETVGSARHFDNNDIGFHMNWGVLGVMKKVRTGKIRRVKIK